MISTLRRLLFSSHPLPTDNRMVKATIVHFWSLPGKESEMKAALLKAKETFQKDEGTLNWFILQDPKDPSAWSLVERYADDAAFQTHMANPYLKEFFGVVGPIMSTEEGKQRQILSYDEL
ncbi:antibiotic biosynthesis monooxygenase protein [Favolaschia claudopus]|uniref:Antibiotic biosynthesis monooxygenase protein n=1 Tax=Favolaschia claudopus TaxID=2862362 RepID=A0AAW0DMK0_9AGAR